MNIGGVPLLPVIVCGIVYMILGMIWYSPMLFGSLWVKLTGKKMEEMDKSNLGTMYGSSFVASMIMAWIIGIMLNALGITTLAMSLQFGFMAWLGFSFVSTYIQNMYQGKPLHLTVVDSGYFLVSILLMCMVFYYM